MGPSFPVNTRVSGTDVLKEKEKSAKFISINPVIYMYACMYVKKKHAIHMQTTPDDGLFFRENFGKFIYQFQPKTKTLIRNIKLYRQNVSLLFNQTC